LFASIGKKIQRQDVKTLEPKVCLSADSSVAISMRFVSIRRATTWARLLRDYAFLPFSPIWLDALFVVGPFLT